MASQFNLLEMTVPGIIPEKGVGIYEFDKTQGSACAIKHALKIFVTTPLDVRIVSYGGPNYWIKLLVNEMI